MKDKKKGLLYLFAIVLAIVLSTTVVLIGIGPQHKGSAKNIKLGLDLAGGVSITYQTVDETPTSEEMSDTIYKLQKRVENYSTESAVYQEGNNRINVDIPGVTDANKILAELGNAGSLEFVDADGNVVLTGSDIASAEAVTSKDNLNNLEYIVQLTLNSSGKTKFAKATKENVGKIIYIVYDDEVISAPTVTSEITEGIAQISGQSTYKEAENLASTIRIGALPLKLQELRSNEVGAKLGIEALHTSLLAGGIGFILVLLFMICVYRIPGVAASIALTLYVSLMLLVLNGFDVTLTLPGIAGIILSIGMAVDANVIIFTRIKEELATGKTVNSAIKLGFNKALSAIVDGNITTLIAAAVLWFKGSGTIKGFAQTLAIGILLSMFTALVITKLLVKAFYSFGAKDVKFYGMKKEHKSFPFIKYAKVFYGISIIVIGIGIGALFVNHANTGDILNYGLDFKGGTSTEVTFNDSLSDTIQSDLEKLVSDAIDDGNVETSIVSNSNSVIIKTRELSLEERTNIADRLMKEYNITAENIVAESISGTVSKEMKSDAIISVIIAAISMLLYIWIRFKDIRFSVSAVLALLHDVLVVLMVYAVTKITIGTTFIACMLTIVGYSINATIVIFDRIRENKKVANRTNNTVDIVNESISQTLSRSINTSLTTFIMVFVLSILGVSSIKEFAIPLMAGIICGAYSSICITGTLWYFLTKIGSKKSVK